VCNGKAWVKKIGGLVQLTFMIPTTATGKPRIVCLSSIAAMFWTW